GWALRRQLTTELSLSALQMALATRPLKPGLMHHSDQGTQYAAADYIALLVKHQIRISMSRTGNPYDNAKAERFMRTVKYEAVYLAVDELNEQLPKGVQVEKSLDAPLYGATGKLESLDFVTLIMEVEEKINAEFGTDITIADDNLLSKEKSPFSTLGTLNDYLYELLTKEGAL